jgi:hypothetical protein
VGRRISGRQEEERDTAVATFCRESLRDTVCASLGEVEVVDEDLIRACNGDGNSSKAQQNRWNITSLCPKITIFQILMVEDDGRISVATVDGISDIPKYERILSVSDTIREEEQKNRLLRWNGLEKDV